MQFQIPQFIEVEDKIFGPLTFRQFLYLAGGAGLCFVLYVYLPIYLAIFPIAGVAGLAIALTFYKYNGRNFIYTLEAFSKYFISKKLYLWGKEKHRELTAIPPKVTKVEPTGVNLPRLSESRLKELSWSLDIKDTNKQQVEE